jgi:hypothetical protein
LPPAAGFCISGLCAAPDQQHQQQQQAAAGAGQWWGAAALMAKWGGPHHHHRQQHAPGSISSCFGLRRRNYVLVGAARSLINRRPSLHAAAVNKMTYFVNTCRL